MLEFAAMSRSPSYTSLNEEFVTLRDIPSTNGMFMQITESEEVKNFSSSTEYTSTFVKAEQISIPRPVYVKKNDHGEDEGIGYNSIAMDNHVSRLILISNVG